MDTHQTAAKRAAAERALEAVQDGMSLGLGSGSTARLFVEGLGRRVRDGLKVWGVPTSDTTAELARGLGIELRDSIEKPLDLTVDGADEIDPNLNLIKGLGGALLREKVVAAASARMIVVATADKMVPHLGRGPLPVEVLPMLWEMTARAMAEAGLEPRLRSGPNGTYLSDNGNHVLDCGFQPGTDLAALAARLDAIPGVLGHGLFLGIAGQAIVADGDQVRVIDSPAT
jgi:ribose 5-phosphate isomerase A